MEDNTKKKCIVMARSAGFILLFLTVSAVLVNAKGSVAPPPAQGVRLTPNGNPTWKALYFHMFSAPVGTAATRYAEFLDTILAVLPPTHHVYVDGRGAGPGAPHSPPYDAEVAEGVAKLGFHEEVHFDQSEFSNCQGIRLAWMNVPFPSSKGSSPVFTSGPTTPNGLFPIIFRGQDLHYNKQFSVLADTAVPPITGDVEPRFNTLDGHSHFPFFVADNEDFGPLNAKLSRSYLRQLTMVDRLGNGCQIELNFTVAFDVAFLPWVFKICDSSCTCIGPTVVIFCLQGLSPPFESRGVSIPEKKCSTESLWYPVASRLASLGEHQTLDLTT